MKINASLTITRPQSSSGRKYISIEICDEASHLQFLDAEISLEDFASALTGHSCVDMTAELRGLEYVGKTRVNETRTIVCPLADYSREVLRDWLKENAQEEGWIVNTYLGSQGSVTRHESGGQLLRYSVTKYIDHETNTRTTR